MCIVCSADLAYEVSNIIFFKNYIIVSSAVIVIGALKVSWWKKKKKKKKDAMCLVTPSLFCWDIVIISYLAWEQNHYAIC